jgi:hypothetical protein
MEIILEDVGNPFAFAFGIESLIMAIISKSIPCVGRPTGTVLERSLWVSNKKLDLQHFRSRVSAISVLRSSFYWHYCLLGDP